MAQDDNKTPAEAGQPAAVPAKVRKPRTPKAPKAAKVTEGAAPAEPQAQPAAAPAKERKPRAPKASKPVQRESAAPAPAAAPAVTEASAPKPAKVRKPRAPKAAKPAQSEPAAPAPAAPQAPAVPQETRAPQPQSQREQRDNREQREPRDNNRDSRELEPAPGFAAPETVGGNEGGNNGGRRNKRRRNKRRGNDAQQQPQPQQNPRIDPAELVRRAWKIYLGEVTEEGLALMDDRTAAEASRRAFRVAEIFLIEAARHQRPEPVPASREEAPEASDADAAAEGGDEESDS